MTTLSGIALECPDPAVLAEFYAALLGTPVVYRSPDWHSVEAAGLHLSFQRAPGHRPPAWPDPASSMQFHLHFRVPDLDEAERLVIGLGAGRPAHQPDPARHRVFTDPAGHPFCLCPAPRARSAP
jgi:catechol 2,3-dioxygenase-like lactoylglutathione lyase family enzyme